MRRLAAAFALALALAGSADADIFQVLPSAPATLPSAALPNEPGSIDFPTALRNHPVATQTLTYPQMLGMWQQAGSAYGIPWQVLAAINKVESNFGRNMGPSSAGAIGWMQFMPSTWERWGLDANGDGLADPWDPADAINGAARYLAASGGQTNIAGAVFSYNHAQWYVDEVLGVAQAFGTAGIDQTFNLDQLQISLQQARRAVAHANSRLVAAQRVARRLIRHEQAIRRVRVATSLLSDRLTLDRRAVQAAVVRIAAQSRVERLQAELDRAQTALAAAHDRSIASAFSSQAVTLLGAPDQNGNYVFPVGGGPSVVSVSHHHHDYPAADIAAPMGSPVYALSDAVVLRAWQEPDPRCGIGLTLKTTDGLTWTYCHLSYLDPAVTQDVVLTAGTQIGLVGATGDATGPHLHLQLDPPSSYPQLQPWFQGFANVAFRWQDEGPTDAVPAKPGPVFEVVPTETAKSGDSLVLFTR